MKSKRKKYQGELVVEGRSRINYILNNNGETRKKCRQEEDAEKLLILKMKHKRILMTNKMRIKYK